MLDKFLNNTHLPLMVGYALAILSLAMIYVMMFVNRKPVLEDLRGADGHWQILELSAILWMILMPVMVICDLLGVHASNSAWTTMDAIYLINVGGKVSTKYFNTRKSEEKKEPGGEEPKI